MNKAVTLERLVGLRYVFKSLLELQLIGFLRNSGDDFCDNPDYYCNEFGIDEDEEDGVTVTRVYNFYDNGGCFFSLPTEALHDINTNCNTVDELLNQCDDTFIHWAFQCLYVVKKNGKESLKYYALYNDGVDFKDELSEPEHGYVKDLPLSVISYIIDVIYKIETNHGTSKYHSSDQT